MLVNIYLRILACVRVTVGSNIEGLRRVQAWSKALERRKRKAKRSRYAQERVCACQDNMRTWFHARRLVSSQMPAMSASFPILARFESEAVPAKVKRTCFPFPSMVDFLIEAHEPGSTALYFYWYYLRRKRGYAARRPTTRRGIRSVEIVTLGGAEGVPTGNPE